MHIYGLIIGISIALGYVLFENIAKKYKILHIDSLFILVVIFGILGARLYHVVTDISLYYPNNLINVLYIWNGGLGIYGAVIGGVVGYVLWKVIVRPKQHTLFFLDVAAFILPLSQSIGRWGNFVNQEIYGKPTQLPIGIFIDLDSRVSGYEQYQYFHPLFLYESIVLFIFWLVLFMRAKKNSLSFGSGKVFSIYLVVYSVTRFCLDGIRINPSMIGILTTAQWVSIVFFVIGVFGYVISNKRNNTQT